MLLVVTMILPSCCTAAADDDTARLVKGVEESLLKMFSLSKRPRPDRSKVVIPDALIQLYRQQTGLDVDTTSLNAPGKSTGSANTVRSFTHKGERAIRARRLLRITFLSRAVSFSRRAAFRVRDSYIL
jgi:TGF-beta propeptide